MSEEKNGRYYKESSEKLALKIGINRATRSGTKALYGNSRLQRTAGACRCTEIFWKQNMYWCAIMIYGIMYTSGVIIVFGFTEISAL